MARKSFGRLIDQKDLLLNHNNINAIDANLVGEIAIHEGTSPKHGEAPKSFYRAYGNIREELEKASRHPSVANLPFAYFDYKAKIPAKK